MFSLSIIIILVSVLLLYIPSSKIEYNSSLKQVSQMEEWFSKRKSLCFVLSGLCFVIGTIALIQELGMTNGIIGGIVLWSLLASTITFLGAFPKVRLTYVVILFLITMCLEFTL